MFKTTYTYDWFTHNIPNWQKWLKKFQNKDNLSFLELGCFEGLATRWLLDNYLTGKNCKITVVDTFLGSMEHKGLDNSMIFTNFMHNVGTDIRVDVFPITTKSYLKNSMKLFDFVYIDASHKAKDVLSDAILAWDILKKNGILIFDDYGWKKYPEKSLLHPKPAIDCFLKIFKGEYILIDRSYQVCISKRG